jgi:3-oxoacyl-[acyl-carrier-protein] synthase II
MHRRVVITGLGVVSSIGIGWREFWKGLLAGKSGIGPVTSFDTSEHFTHNGGEVRNFRPEEFIAPNELSKMSRATHMAVAATRLAIEDAGLDPHTIEPGRTGVSHGTTLGSVQTAEEINELMVKHGRTDIDREMLLRTATHSTPAAVAGILHATGANFMISTACSAGNYAVAYGYDLIRLGRCDLMFAGASDPFSRVAFTGFNQFKAVAPERCQPFDRERKGMMVAEGAGTLVLESLERAVSRNAKIYAEVAGCGLSCDARHMTSPSFAGIVQCMRRALREAGMGPEDIDYVSAHGTGTLNNDRAECTAFREVFGPRYRDVPISSIKSMLGHTMGAASALEAIACALAVTYDMVPPTINMENADPECDIDCVPNHARQHVVRVAMNNSYAFGGNNLSLIIMKNDFIRPGDIHAGKH